MRLILVSAVALVDAQSRVLLARRPAGKQLAGLWEFPGGKVEPGETPEAALVRELEEELGIGTVAPDFAPLAFASHTYENFHLLMPLYACHAWTGEIFPTEHDGLEWVAPGDLASYAMPPADLPLIGPLSEYLRRRSKSA